MFSKILKLKHVIVLAQVVQNVDTTFNWINHYPGDSEVSLIKTYPLDSNLSSG